MRTGITLIGLAVCVSCQAEGQLPLPDRFGNTYSLPSFPSQATPTTYQPTPMYGLTIGNNTSLNVYTERQELNGGVTIINEKGMRNKLITCQRTSTGEVICN
jgi:hypothetical protein